MKILTLSLFLVIFGANLSFAKGDHLNLALTGVKAKTTEQKFNIYKRKIKKLRKRNIIEGNSYIISGALSLVGGTVGGSISEDQTEQLAYSAFQSIGVAAIGYGLYKKKIGDEREHVFELIDKTPFLSAKEKYQLLTNYYAAKKKRERRERLIKALTHGLVGALNVYSASQQANDRLSTTLFFVGGVNLLACVSYSF